MSEKNELQKPSFTDYLTILLKWKKFLIINLLLIGLVTTGISFLIPEKFKSVTTVMIQNSDTGGILGGMMSDFGGVLGKAFGLGGGSAEDKLFGYLGSNQLAEKIIDKFNLVEYYEIEEYKRDKTLKAFREDFTADLNDNGFIEISMIHKNPETSAAIVNYAVEELEKMNRKYAVSYAKKYREFVEKRYFQNLKDIEDAENRLETFQKKYKIYAIPEQFQVAFQAFAELEKELALNELKRDLFLATKGKNSSEYKQSQIQINLLKKKISDLKKGGSQINGSVVFLDLEKLPEIEKQYIRIKRDLEVQSKLLEFTLPMYEQAVMEEQKNIPIITVIDKGVPPELKYSPKKAFIILSVFFLALFVHVPFVFRMHKMLTNNPRNDFETKEKAFYEKLAGKYKIRLS